LPHRRETIRFATFNVALARSAPGALAEALGGADDPQARAVAEIIQRVRPDVLLLNEFDYDADGLALQRFRENYLACGRNGAEAMSYPHAFAAPVNTGVPSGLDLDRDGRTDGPGDALGFGAFAGQYGMALLSMHPLRTDGIRTFRELRWGDMPGALLPSVPETDEPWFDGEAAAVVRLSSKSHWDVPVRVGAREIHLLCSHPTPPVFDGAERRNARRNHDEIRFWADYLNENRAGYIRDDAGRRGGLSATEPFVVLGDLNADPHNGHSWPGAIEQLLAHPRINTESPPASAGARGAALDKSHPCVRAGKLPALHTADFGDDGPGNLRVDYVLPARELTVRDGGVFWPERTDPLFRLIGDYPFASSDHRLVWLDVDTPRDNDEGGMQR
jgi:alkaline phosphatase D